MMRAGRSPLAYPHGPWERRNERRKSMKETVKMSRAVGQLEKMYNTMNADFFGGALPVPIITVQSKPGTWGHCSRAQIWKRKGETAYEMNIAAEAVGQELEEIMDTLLHEMVHLYCRENGIQEVSRGGTYHNGKFKELAEKVGLVCVEAGKYGWNTQGHGNDRLTEYALAKGWNEIKIGRESVPSYLWVPPTQGSKEQGQGPKPERTSSTYKLQCPKCKCSVRATKQGLRIKCMACDEEMLKV